MKRPIKLITILISAVMLCCLTGCMSVAAKYDNADKYDAGDREFGGEVTELDIDWSSGSVTVSRHDGDTVSVTETCKEELSDSKKVHTWLEGSVLHVRFSKSGETFFTSTPEKKLEIKLPRDLKLKSLDFNGSSAETSFEDISADIIRADVSSGDLRFYSCSADSFKLESSSGNIELEQKGESESIKAEASSGKINLTAETAGELDLDTSSGDVTVKVQKANKLISNASSGETEIHLEEMPSETRIEASSGDVAVYLPKDADFTGTIDTSSGKVNSDLPLSNSGKTYTCGSGTNALFIETSSGDVALRAQ